jgi:hypothetical protein
MCAITPIAIARPCRFASFRLRCTQYDGHIRAAVSCFYFVPTRHGVVDWCVLFIVVCLFVFTFSATTLALFGERLLEVDGLYTAFVESKLIHYRSFKSIENLLYYYHLFKFVGLHRVLQWHIKQRADDHCVCSDTQFCVDDAVSVRTQLKSMLPTKQTPVISVTIDSKRRSLISIIPSHLFSTCTLESGVNKALRKRIDEKLPVLAFDQISNAVICRIGRNNARTRAHLYFHPTQSCLHRYLCVHHVEM